MATSSYRPPLELGDVGKAVEAAQIATWRCLEGALDGVALNARNGQFGTGLLRDVKVIQRVFDIRVFDKAHPDGYVTGRIGKRTWAVLESFLDERGHVLLNAAAVDEANAMHTSQAQKITNAIVSNWHEAIDHPSRWRYRGLRPVNLAWPVEDGDVVETDCSGMVWKITRRSGGEVDPNGFGWIDGAGRSFTGWMRDAARRKVDGLRVLPIEEGRRGDLAHYGNTEGAQHVGQLIEDFHGSQTSIGSFGSNPPSRRDIDRPGYRPLDFVTRLPVLRA